MKKTYALKNGKTVRLVGQPWTNDDGTEKVCVVYLSEGREKGPIRRIKTSGITGFIN